MKAGRRGALDAGGGYDERALGPLVDAAMMGLGGSSPRELRRPEVERLLEAAYRGLRPAW